ncbi:MAG: glycosyltransferase family 2 protein [bacterium]
MFTVVINSYNNESPITECIESAYLLTDSIVVVDMESTDQTVVIAKKLGATVTSFPPSRYVEPARMAGITLAPGDWVCILDTDERITQELASEIKKTVATVDELTTHFRIPRKNMFGKSTWLKHGGWWPDHQIRLIKKSALIEWPARIHSTPQIEGMSGQLESPLIHYFHGDVEGMVRKTAVFEDIESALLYDAKRSVGIPTFFRKYTGELVRRLITQQGFRDGTYGWLESIYQAFSKTITWLYLYEKTYISKPLKNNS